MEVTENPIEPLGLPVRRIVLAEDVSSEPDGAFIGVGTKEEYAKFEREEKGLKNVFGLDDEKPE